MRIFRFALIGLGLLLLANCTSDKENANRLLAKGKEAFLAGQYRQARDYLGKALEFDPSNHDIIYYMGVSYQKEYVYDSALFYLRKADLLYKNNLEINNAILEVAPHVKEYEMAIDAMRALIRMGQPPEQYYDKMVEYHTYLHHFVHVLYYCRKLVAENPDDTSAYLHLIGAAVNASSLSTASAYLDSAIDRFGPRDEFEANRAAILSMYGKLNQAENIFRSLLAKDSTNPYLKLNLASTLSSYDKRSKKEEALKLLEDIRLELGTGFGIDSLIARTRAELKEMN